MSSGLDGEEEGGGDDDDDIDFDFPNADDADSVPDAEINKYSLGVGGGEGILC